MATEKKKKTHTSTEVKNRYNKKTYTRISLSVKNDIAEKYKAKCKEKNIPYVAPLHEAINNFLSNEDDQ